MSDKPEPLAAILAEMRDLADHRAADAGGERPAIELLRSYADRIEAAAKRERNAHTNDIHDALYMATGIPGNAAAMREALEEQLRYWDSHIRTRDEEEMRKRTEDAISAPARNCDVGTAHEQYVRFEKHCNRKWKDYTNTDMRRPFPCGRNDITNNPCARCFATWSQMPFAPEEGGAE